MLRDYQVSVLDGSFVEQALLAPLSVSYILGLNMLTAAAINLGANDAQIAECTLRRYIQIKRDGVIVWVGRLETPSWVDDSDPGAQAGMIYALDAKGLEHYLKQRTLPRPAGDDFDVRTGYADDVAKAYVRYSAGSLAATGRPCADLFVQADAGDAPVTAKRLLGSTVSEHINTIAAEGGFWWSVVPHFTTGALDGGEFKTAYPLWGLDRTRGNGVNVELELSRTAGTVERVAYRGGCGDDHVNVVYVYGAGSGALQAVRVRSDAAAIALWGRREAWLDAGNYATDAELDAEGDRYLYEHRAKVALTADVLPGVLDITNLGDKCTVATNRFGVSVEQDAVITALAMSVDVDGIETITPTMVTV